MYTMRFPWIAANHAARVDISDGPKFRRSHLINPRTNIALSRLLHTHNVMKPKGWQEQDLPLLQHSFHGGRPGGPGQPRTFFGLHATLTVAVVILVQIFQMRKIQERVAKDGRVA